MAQYAGAVFRSLAAMKNIRSRLFTEPVPHDPGTGTKLLNYAVRILHADYLWVLEKNVRAVPFYERNGFHKTGRKKTGGRNRRIPSSYGINSVKTLHHIEKGDYQYVIDH